MIIFNLLLFACLLPKYIVFFVFSIKFKPVPAINENELPTVSVLIPARDEAQNLPGCLESLLFLDYPIDKFEIIIGNDQSVDATEAIAQNYTDRYDHIKLINVKPEMNGLIARSNVLAQLATASENDFLVFLDADMEVSTDWLRQMVAPTVHGYDIVSGYTEVKANGWFSSFQKFDWISVIMLLKTGADINKPGTALGNNMLVSKTAYEAVGGYEKIGPTFTEDNDLTLAAGAKGYRLFQLVVEGGAKTLPMTSWKELYKQRNRWMQGAFKQPLVRLIPLLMARVFVLIVIFIMIFNIGAGIGTLLFVSLLDVVLSLVMSAKIKKFVPLYIAVFAPVFNSLLDTFTLLSYPWNRRVIWKGRKL